MPLKTPLLYDHKVHRCCIEYHETTTQAPDHKPPAMNPTENVFVILPAKSPIDSTYIIFFKQWQYLLESTSISSCHILCTYHWTPELFRYVKNKAYEAMILAITLVAVLSMPSILLPIVLTPIAVFAKPIVFRFKDFTKFRH